MLVDVREIDLRTSLLGVPLSSPVGVAPMGGLVLFHPEGDAEMARGAGKADTLQWSAPGRPAGPSRTSPAPAAPQMFQLYHHGDRGWVSELLKRVESLATRPSPSPSTRSTTAGASATPWRAGACKAMEIAPNPRGPFHDYQMRLTWADVEWLMKTTKLPVGLKGILTVADARRAAEMGVRLIWVLEPRRTPARSHAVVDRGAAAHRRRGRRPRRIVIDGGFSKGTDVIKGLARGAKVVMLGRTALWGLAADGAEGVARVFEILRDQLHVAMGLCGRTKISDLKPDLIFRAD